MVSPIFVFMTYLKFLISLSKHLIFCVFILVTLAVFFSCSKEEINSDASFRLEFSNDTILFDTVFTSIGTTTKTLIVHNNSNQKAIIRSVRLAKGESSSYRINIDGEAAYEVNDLEIGARDSLFIFIKLTIDPNNANTPLIETDSVVFNTNGNTQDVKLVAWGQDANFYANDTLRGEVTFTSAKPFVIYGKLVVDSLCHLNIEEGCRLYFHQNSGILVRNGASIIVRGAMESPVEFRGDNLIHEEEEVPGQWLGIEIEGGSTGNEFNYARILNGRFGIAADSSWNLSQPSVILYNSIIHNMVNYGLLSTHNSILAMNCQFSNCGAYAVAIEGGGKCEFRHCTIANYLGFTSFHYPALLLSNNIRYEDGSFTGFPLEEAYFGNCIISGKSQEEIEQDSTAGVGFNFRFDHCFVQSGLAESHQFAFPGCVVNMEAKFKDAVAGNFELDTLSDCKDKGISSIITISPRDITKDIKGNSRTDDLAPDLGCYERKEGK